MQASWRSLLSRFGRAIASVVLLSLIASCASSRRASSSHSEQVRSERVETVEKADSVIVEQRDTLREITTITIDRNDRGDTLKVVQITDLTRARSRDNVVAQKVKTEIVRDTVYIERRDSVLVEKVQGSSVQGSKASPVVSALKWIFWIIFAIMGLIITIKVCLRRI